MPMRWFQLWVMVWIYASFVTWRRVHLVLKQKALDYWLPFSRAALVFCPCFGHFVFCLLLDCSTSQTYQNVAKEPFFLTEDENTRKALQKSGGQNSKGRCRSIGDCVLKAIKINGLSFRAWRAWVIPHERSVHLHSGPELKSANGHLSRALTSREYSNTNMSVAGQCVCPENYRPSRRNMQECERKCL